MAELAKVVVAARVNGAVVQQDERVIDARRDLLDASIAGEVLVLGGRRDVVLFDTAEAELAQTCAPEAQHVGDVGRVVQHSI